ncbi:MAG TPA: hypothetical protein VMT66_00690 [Steroidobacteraceae bacterium]|nr:hypothetical protein [Steroidobacteraceae bacterium]
MPGSSTAAAPLPPARLIARLLVAAAVVLYLLHTAGSLVLEPLVPVFRAIIGGIDPQFVITDAFTGHEDASEVLIFRANLREAVTVAGQVIYPFGTHGVPEGGFQVSYTVGGVLLDDALMVIILLVWPAQRVWELLVRLLLGLPAMTVLLLIGVPSTVVAELQHALQTQVDTHALGGWLIWSRFLMGGGGMALSSLLALLVIRGTRRFAPPAPGGGAALRST